MIRKPGFISFPQDAASHPASNAEWRYCFALLEGDFGNRYAVMASFFRVGELAVPKGHYLIHSLTRLNEGKSETRSLMDRMLALQMAAVYLPVYLVLHPSDRHTRELYGMLLKGSLPAPHSFLPFASVGSRPPRLAYGNDTMIFADDDRTGFELRLRTGGGRLRLRYFPRKPVSLIDEEGSLNGLRYYSVTRNLVSGELYRDDGKIERLQGEGWYDHQWGRNYGLLRGDGWDWFGLQLDDGRDLLVNRLRRSDGTATARAKMILADGSVVPTEQVVLRATSYWQSGTTSAVYPSCWEISLPDFRLELRVTPMIAEQEMPIAGPLRAIWEGACSVAGFERLPDGGRRRTSGRGFVELVGYA